MLTNTANHWGIEVKGLLGEDAICVQGRETHMLEARSQIVRVISGAAWISFDGRDFVVEAGQAIQLQPGGDNTAAICGLRRRPVIFEVLS